MLTSMQCSPWDPQVEGPWASHSASLAMGCDPEVGVLGACVQESSTRGSSEGDGVLRAHLSLLDWGEEAGVLQRRGLRPPAVSPRVQR